jgi:aspartate racemase
MMQSLEQETVGVLGGMGPLASASFVRTIYSAYRGQVEQESPIVLLYSNPKVQDRTKTFLEGGDHQGILAELENGLRHLVAQGATQLVICCITAHYLLAELPHDLRERVVSLIDVIFEELQGNQKTCLLASTTGTRRLGLFQQHPSWRGVQHRIALPSDDEQQRLHEAIYLFKRDQRPGHLIKVLLSICQAHEVDTMIAGCTELHLVSKAAAGPNALNQKIQIIDPLAAIATRYSEEFCVAQI